MQTLDLCQIEAANLPSEGEESMATQPERLASLESTMSVVKGTLVVLVPSLLLWGWFITTNVIAIKQQLADGGNKQIVAQLKNPSSPQQLQANLSTVIAQIQTTSANGTKMSSKKVAALSGAVAQVIQTNPSVPEVWPAASQLAMVRPTTLSPALIPANYVFPPGPFHPNTVNCFDLKIPSIYGRESAEDPYVSATLLLRNCTFALDDLKAFYAHEEAAQAKTIYGYRKLQINIVLIGVHVTYGGGPVIPFQSLQAFNCTYQFSLPSVPPSLGSELVETLLTAQTDVNFFSVGTGMSG